MKEEINEIDAKNEVTKLLNDFDADYYSDDVNQLRKKYSGYVAMYTKFIFKPEIAIRGINPSWFIGKEPLTTQDKEKEVFRVNSLRGLHDLNAYIDYPEAKYHGGVKRTFKNIFDIDELKYTDDEIDIWIKENVVGWNNCFIQTGSEGIDNLYKDAAAIDRLNYNSSCIDLIKKSVSVAKKLERLMQPKIIIYAGLDSAQENRWTKQKYKSLESIKSSPKLTSWGGKAIGVKHFSYNDKPSVREFQIIEARQEK